MAWADVLSSCASDRSRGAAESAASAEPEPIRNAQILFAGGTTPPPDSAPWQPQSLPDDWSRSRPDHSGDAWYRIALPDVGQGEALLALYIPRLSMTGTAFLNGIALGELGRLDEPMTRLWYRPQLYRIPSALLAAGSNVIHVRIRAYPDSQGGLSEVHFGAAAPLVERWSAHVFRQVTAMQITTGITAALTLLVLVAWVVLRWHAAYGWFGLATTFWTLHALLVLTVDIPVPVLAWEVAILSSLAWVIVAMMMFALRFAELKRPSLERAALAYAALLPALLGFAGLHQIFVVANLCLLVLILIGIYEFVILVEVARRSRSIESMLLVAAAVWVLVLGVHDWLTRQGFWPYGEPFEMHYGLPVLFVSVFWNLLGQVAAARRATETMNRELEARVRSKTEELERSAERIRSADAAQTLAAERERIMRDMHDGVGSKLIATRQLAEHGALSPPELTALLDECIDDLRLMIDSLEPAEGDLLTVLGNLRYRLEDRLARQGIALEWNVSDLPAFPELSSRDILQILRIVQEAFTNVIKHARATRVELRVGLASDGRWVRVTIRDDGLGLPELRANSSTRGRGLSNMNQRARAVGGRLEVVGEAGGCLVSLELPVAEKSLGLHRGHDS
jgi:signal transduction histidine kinase